MKTLRNMCRLGFVLLAAGAAMNADAQITLAENGKSEYRIVISRDAIPSEKYAAEELQRYLEKMSGARLPILTDAADAAEREIVLGARNTHRSPAAAAKAASLGADGFFLCTNGDQLSISGDQPRGTLYGVYEVLEKLGVRWYTPEVEHVPKRDKVELPALNELQHPGFESREVYWTEFIRDADFAARHRLNGNHSKLTDKHGGRFAVYHPFVHTFDALIPPSLFGRHPEYFSFINGRRTGPGGTQRCLTNPEVLRLAVDQVRRWIREHPEASIISVSQNDNQNYCRCPQCKAIDDAEGTPCGSLLTFVNAVAAAIETDHPSVRIDTLAYQYTRRQPKTIRPRPNVIARLCSIECCFAHPLDTCPSPRNQSFRADIEAWHRVAPTLYVWDYTTDFRGYQQPFPNFDALQANVRFYRKHGVKGMFEQGNYSRGGAGEMEPLRAYLLAKLLWNPDCDVKQLTDDFLEGYYGKAAPKIREYLELEQQQVRGKDVHAGIFDRPNAPYLNDAFMQGALKLFDDAETLADNGDVRFRVQVARLPVMYVMLATNRVKPESRAEWVRNFLAVARKAGVTEIREGRSLNDWARQMGAR